MKLASDRPQVHARHVLSPQPPYSLDDVLHLTRYQWAVEQATPVATAIDFGCGTGFGVATLSGTCGQVIGVDFDPAVVELNERLALPNAKFIRADLSSPTTRDQLPPANLIVSMETIEHLSDYFTFLETAAALLAPNGTLIVGTPNRTMTYERYPNRRHMDPSHVQEFTALSLGHTLVQYFSDVTIHYQYVAGYWARNTLRAEAAPASIMREKVKAWIPPAALAIAQRIRESDTPSSAPSFSPNDVGFQRVDAIPDLATEAFCLIAVCKP